MRRQRCEKVEYIERKVQPESVVESNNLKHRKVTEKDSKISIDMLLRTNLLQNGADLVGYGDITELPSNLRQGLPVGVIVALKFPKNIIIGIRNLPTKEYHKYKDLLNKKLDVLVELGAQILRKEGFFAIPQTMAYVNSLKIGDVTLLPHKTVATRAGIGWIGKCALLVTETFGSMIRISSILTDAPLEVAQPINKSRCGDCLNCTDTCPAGAVFGKLWSAGIKLEDLVDTAACRKRMSERSLRGFGVEDTVCGKCIEICPYTRRYLNENEE
jgi:epoxyqueuosine reductase QueG